MRKLTAAALPTLTTNPLEAWNVLLAGAIRVSSATTWPSATTEIQEFSEARTTSVRAPVAGSDAFGRGLPKLRTVTSFLSSFLS